MDVLLYVFAAFLVGLTSGGAMAAAKWRENADRIQRIESAGRLYKVYRLAPRQWHLEDHEYQHACWMASKGNLEDNLGGE